MAETNKSYRMRTSVGGDKYLDISLEQDYENFEFLTLNLTRENIYKLHTANYGCIAGRVLANEAFGIPNAKVSVFIPTEESEEIDPILRGLYPYDRTTDENSEHVRYNTLPDEIGDDLCHQNIGTFPNKRLVLDDNNVLEIYDRYYRFSTVTNDAGDYMIYGVPVGQHTVHVDIDLSDIGRLSQSPRDMIFKGYNANQFESTSKFRKDTNLGSLVQVISEDSSVDVKPFWGDESEGTVAITRNDVKIRYKFETYCVFMGSLVTDSDENFISKRCIPAGKQGSMDQLTAGQGTIEMIRKTADGNVESFSIQGTRLIDGSGTWCYQIPMNLDYVGTDEYGNIVATNDPTKGIATRTEVRFRVSMTDNGRETHKLPKVLIPNNPQDGGELDYAFGTYTKDSSFRSLFYNNVYSIKSFIPRLQKGNNQNNKRFTGIKTVNGVTDSNRFPYNNMRIQMKFMFVLMCALLKTLIRIVRIVNKWRSKWSKKNCIVVGDGICPDLEGWYFAPGCRGDNLEKTLNNIDSDEGGDTSDEADSPQELDDQSSVEYANKNENICLTGKITYLMECVEISLAMEHDVINFDFYNDWINGTVYLPKWYGAIRRKNSYLFGLIKIKEKTVGCMEDTVQYSRRYTQQCALDYQTSGEGTFYTNISSPAGCSGSSSKYRCHKAAGRKYIKIFGTNGGLVHKENTIKEDKVYYLKPCEFREKYGSHRTRSIFFATDIILLGSLTVRNDDGIPMFYNRLLATSYQLPTNLASTNMDSEGYNFATDKDTACNGQTLSSGEANRVPQTTAGYNQWSIGTDAVETDNEAAVTEAAGIDWGYLGPDQENMRSSLYFPSGHFLGIGCALAEVNVKSCVNLERACEIGTELSQRHEIVKSVTSGGVEYDYITPSGIINRHDINDDECRRIFATLNYNGLKTKLDAETTYPKYDFISSLVNGFDGVFNDYVTNNVYYNNSTPITGETVFYRLTDETPSEEYYRYRLGIRGADDLEEVKSRYLIHNKDNSVALPVYENSFYFYFGLTKGATAFDRLMSDYYSVCERDENYIPTLDLDAYVDSVGCDANGTADFTVNNYNGVYTVRIYDMKAKEYLPFIAVSTPTIDSTKHFEMNVSGTTSYNTKARHFTFSHLDGGTYIVSITTYVDKTEYSRTFEIGDSTPQEILDIRAYPLNFSGECYNYGSSYDRSKTGSISFVRQDASQSGQTPTSGEVPYNVTAITVSNLNGYTDKWISTKTSYTNIVVTGNNIKFYVRDGNAMYYISYDVLCPNGKTKTYDITTGVYITMSAPLDYYVGTHLVTGRQLESWLGSSTGTSDYHYVKTITNPTSEDMEDTSEYLYRSWINTFIGNTQTDINKQKWIVEKAVVNSAQPSKDQQQSIAFGYCLGAGAPYSKYQVFGHGEKAGRTVPFIMHDGRLTDRAKKTLPPYTEPELTNGVDGFSVNEKLFTFSSSKLMADKEYDEYGILYRKYNAGLGNIVYNAELKYEPYCDYTNKSVYKGGLPYKIPMNVKDTLGASVTRNVYLPSVNIPMYAYATLWLGYVDADGEIQFGTADKPKYKIVFSVNGGVGYRWASSLAPYNYYNYLGDTIYEISNGNKTYSKTVKPYETSMSLVEPPRPPKRKHWLLQCGTAVTFHEEAKAIYTGTVNFSYDFSSPVKLEYTLSDGYPNTATNYESLKLFSMNDSLEATFIPDIDYDVVISSYVGGNTYLYSIRINSFTLVNDDPNVRYFIVNRAFLKAYYDNVENFSDTSSILETSGVFGKWRSTPINPQSDPRIQQKYVNTPWFDEIDLRNSTPQSIVRTYTSLYYFTTGGVNRDIENCHPSDPLHDEAVDSQCYIIAMVNPFTKKSGSLSDINSDIRRAYHYQTGLDSESNYNTIIKIYDRNDVIRN